MLKKQDLSMFIYPRTILVIMKNLGLYILEKAIIRGVKNRESINANYNIQELFSKKKREQHSKQLSEQSGVHSEDFPDFQD